MSFLARIHRQRSREFSVSIFDVDDNDENLSAGDIVVLRVGSVGNQQSELEIRSGETTDGDSTITYTAGTNDCTIRIGMVDALELTRPIYDCELFVIDASDVDSASSPRYKHCEMGVLHVQGSLPETPEDQSSSSSESSSST